MTPDQVRWTEALAVQKQFGSGAPAHIAERIETLASAGDEAGVNRWREIAARYDQLHGGTIQ